MCILRGYNTLIQIHNTQKSDQCKYTETQYKDTGKKQYTGKDTQYADREIHNAARKFRDTQYTNKDIHSTWLQGNKDAQYNTDKQNIEMQMPHREANLF